MRLTVCVSTLRTFAHSATGTPPGSRSPIGTLLSGVTILPEILHPHNNVMTVSICAAVMPSAIGNPPLHRPSYLSCLTGALPLSLS
jgi:hypothetical protein